MNRNTSPCHNGISTTAQGCVVQPGTYTVIAEVPEHDSITSNTIEYTSMEDNPCASPDAADPHRIAELAGRPTVRLNAEAFTSEANHLRMAQPCTFEVAFLNEEDNTRPPIPDPVRCLRRSQNPPAGRIPSPSNLMRLTSAWFKDGSPLLPDGFYTLEASRCCPRHPPRLTFPLAWPADFGAQETDERSLKHIDVRTHRQLDGLLTRQGTCYVMEADEETYLLSNARTLSSWQPSF